MLSFQRLDVYQRALEFVVLVRDVVADLPDDRAALVERLTAATQSIVGNIARARYERALGAATECVVLFDVLKLSSLVGDVCYAHAIELLEELEPELRSRSCRSRDA
jgi:hypothetical protein